MKTFAAYCIDKETRINSSSGGLFSAIAEYVIQNNGVVYGVKMSANCMFAEYARIDCKKKLPQIRGSKYLQAKLNDTFIKIKKDLEDGILVLFAGTACQINGLSSYLAKEYENLILIDIICHGVPTGKLWNKFLSNRQVWYVNFRDKQNSWEKYGMRLNDAFISYEKNDYMRLYLNDMGIRPSCYNCVSKQQKKSDITLGDFWGIDHIIPDINDHRGISLIICRSPKALDIINIIRPKLNCYEVDYKDAVKYNPAENTSITMPSNREEFFCDIDKLSYEKLCKKYTHRQSILKKIKAHIAYKTRKRMRK